MEGGKSRCQRRQVPGGFGHHHAPVVSHGCGDRTEHEYESPCHVSLGILGRCAEYGAHCHGHGGAGQYAEALHRKNRRYERPSCLLVRKLRHYGRRQRVVSSNPQPQEKPKPKPCP